MSRPTKNLTGRATKPVARNLLGLGHKNLIMSKGTVLIIEDEERIAQWVKTYFERDGFSAEIAPTGKTGLNLARSLNPTLIILDLMLPEIDGITICNTLRTETDTPIIMLTAKTAPPDRIKGLDIGADDYVTKPFDPAELVARANAVLRRVKGTTQAVLTNGPLSLDTTSQAATLFSKPLDLSTAQLALLATFMRHPDQVLTRTQLIESAFSSDFDAYDRAIDTHIKRLRKLLHTDTYHPIQTVYGKGYKFTNEQSESLTTNH